jgi:hypothetical protein
VVAVVAEVVGDFLARTRLALAARNIASAARTLDRAVRRLNKVCGDERFEAVIDLRYRYGDETVSRKLLETSSIDTTGGD